MANEVGGKDTPKKMPNTTPTKVVTTSLIVTVLLILTLQPKTIDSIDFSNLKPNYAFE